MPWVHIGKYRFDLDEVALIQEAVGAERDQGGPGCHVTLRTGICFDLNGEDATAFLAAFDEHTSGRTIGRGPPEPGDEWVEGRFLPGPELDPEPARSPQPGTHQPQVD
jgi:hypothetical protein